MNTIYQRLRNLNTILIDDDPWIQNAMSIVFENEGCALKVMTSAEDALFEIKRNRYDIIICDYLLSGISGIEFFRRLAPWDKNIITLLITGYGNVQIVKDAIEVGVDEILEKPFTTDSLEASISRMMKKRDGRQMGVTLW